MEKSPCSKTTRLVFKDKNREVLRHEYDIKSLHEEIKSIKNYCSDKFTKLEASNTKLEALNTKLEALNTKLEASHNTLLLQWYKVYRRQFIYEVRHFTKSILLTFDQIEFFLGYATQFSDGDMFRQSRKTFTDYLATNRLGLNEFLPNADAHLAIFTTDNRGPLAQGNFAVHSEITLDDISSALQYYKNNFPTVDTTVDFEFWFFTLTTLSNPPSPPSTSLSQFFQHLTAQVEGYAWYTNVAQWRGDKRNEWAISNLPRDIKTLVITEHEKKQEPLTKEKLAEMADLEAKRRALNRLTTVQYRGNIRRSKFVNKFENMMKMCNVLSDRAELFFFEAISKYLGDDCFDDYEEMKAKFLEGEDLEIEDEREEFGLPTLMG